MNTPRRLRRLASAAAAAALAAILAPNAAAQPTAETPKARAASEHRITLDRIPRLVVTLKGRILLDETGATGGPQHWDEDEWNLRGPGCPLQLSTHTDASFSGGSYTAQAGFAQGEIFAASYTLPAANFPARFVSAEAIFVTSNSSVPTTTHYSVIIYNGVPSGSEVLFLERSLDGLIPPVTIGPGTNGVLLQVVIDPSDPDQVFFTNPSGSNQIAVGFRIDQHNSPPANHCTTAPPTCCNAFPCTDVSGVASPTGNWLNALNCGPFACPGGWATFQQMISLCRPSGDWVMRMSWEPVNCPPATGACCLTNGTCDVRGQTQCQQAGGTYQGDGTDCGSITCPPPTGACCFGEGCLQLTQANCAAASGVWLGGGTTCVGGNTCPTGACCLPSGACEIRTSPACTAAGGTFQGVGSSCGTVNCPQPTGACCLSNGGCLVLSQSDCAVIPGSTWRGAGTNCADSNGNGQPDACECRADWNADGQVNSSDISAFITSWLASVNNGTLEADFDGDQIVNSTDISAFITAWLQAVTSGC